ncbi:MAG: hypothetical protein M3348_03685 [Acidobacteriota bacterium]|nr:hypothetical protein [Acidobacteriota bacterium]
MNRLESLERRLERLERQNRRYKASFALLCALAALPFLVAAAQSEKYVNADGVNTKFVRAGNVSARYLRADEVVIGEHEVDGFRLKTGAASNGQNALLVFTGDGENLIAALRPRGLAGAAFELYNKGGEVAATIYERPEEGGGGVNVNQPGGKGAAFLYADRDGGKLSVNNAEGQKMIALWASPLDGGVLEAYDTKLRLGAEIEGGGRLASYVGVRNPDDKSMTLVTTNDYGGMVKLMNRNGNEVGRIGTNRALFGDFSLFDAWGKRTVWLSSQGDGSGGGLRLLRPSGEIISHLP